MKKLLLPACLFSMLVPNLSSAESPQNLTNAAAKSISPTINYLLSDAVEKNTQVIRLEKRKAFPTAEGAGASATGGRGGRVIYVKNRNPSGPDSLREALLSKGKRTIVFAIGGRFNVDVGISLGSKGSDIGRGEYGDFTLAGQTAHDKGGVHLANSGIKRCEWARHFRITGQENMIMRYFDTRFNWQWYVPPAEPGSCDRADQVFNLAQFKEPSLRFSDVNNLILDHMTSGWSSYGVLILNSAIKTDITLGKISIQRSLLHENVMNPSGLGTALQYNHNIGMLLGIDPRRRINSFNVNEWNNMDEFSIHKNAFIGLSHRFPNTGGGDAGKFRTINNYVYGFHGDGAGQRLARIAGNSQNDLINNVYQQTAYSPDFTTKNLYGFRFEVFLPQLPSIPVEKPNFHVSGNLFLNKLGARINLSDDIQADPRKMLHDRGGRTVISNNSGDNLSEVSHGLILRNHPITPNTHPVSVLPATAVKSDILDNVGGNVQFRVDGSTFINDDIDSRYINWANNNSGPISFTTAFGDGGIGDTAGFVYPNYSQQEAVDLNTYDSDLDGMPNTWELKHELEPFIKDHNDTRPDRSWDFSRYPDGNIARYRVENIAGYTNLEMYLADIAGDFHMLAREK